MFGQFLKHFNGGFLDTGAYNDFTEYWVSSVQFKGPGKTADGSVEEMGLRTTLVKLAPSLVVGALLFFVPFQGNLCC